MAKVKYRQHTLGRLISYARYDVTPVSLVLWVCALLPQWVAQSQIQNHSYFPYLSIDFDKIFSVYTDL